MPFRQFVAGEVLTASNVQTFLANQAVITAATAASRPTSPTTGMVVYQQDIKTLQVWDGTAWQQIYPVIGAGITDGTIGTVDLADGSVTSAKIADGTIVGGDIAASTITPSNVANGTYGISISGNAATASSATTASQLNGLVNDTAASVNSIAQRDSGGSLTMNRMNANDLVVANGGVNCYSSTASHITFADLTVFGTMARIPVTGVYFQAVTGRAVQVNTAGTLGTTASTRRVKRDIEDAGLDTAKVLQLRPVHFRYRPDMVEGAGDELHLGLIAEEVADLGLDCLVYEDANGEPAGVDYQLVAVALLDVVKEQQARLDDLTARIEALEAK